MFLDPEASQENLKRPEKVPKRHPKRSKGGPKLGQKVVKKWTQNWAKKMISYLKKSLWPGCFVCVFVAMVPSKNAYFEDVFKMAKKLLKMPKNGPKMIQKWFKIAQIV